VKYIYEIENLINGKTYYGQRDCKLKNPENDNYFGSGFLLKKALKKYNQKKFKKSIIIQGNFSKEEINRFEKCVIRMMRAVGKAEYNLADGGQGGNLGQIVNQKRKATLEKIGSPCKNYKRTEEQKKNQSKKIKLWHENNQNSLVRLNGYLKSSKSLTEYYSIQENRNKCSEITKKSCSKQEVRENKSNGRKKYYEQKENREKTGNSIHCGKYMQKRNNLGKVFVYSLKKSQWENFENITKFLDELKILDGRQTVLALKSNEKTFLKQKIPNNANIIPNTKNYWGFVSNNKYNEELFENMKTLITKRLTK
jgi:hypothetical protein